VGGREADETAADDGDVGALDAHEGDLEAASSNSARST
jgi:hypothetical protein